LNSNGVIDSMGVLYSFLIIGVISGIYSAILMAIDPIGPNLSIKSVDFDLSNRNRYGQGGFQLIGILLIIVLASISALVTGLLFRCMNRFTSSE
jgi:hypothetical protein